MANAFTKNHVWQAEKYSQHSSVQYQAAEQLLEYIQLKGNEQILDVGCGDGKISAMLSRKVPYGQVVGIDLSPEMIEFSRKSFDKKNYINLDFSIQDAHCFDYHGRLDIIFSSFALQWLKEPNLFFICANKSLTPFGYIVATIPLGISSELEEAIRTIISSSTWNDYFINFLPKWHFISADKYKQLIEENHFSLQKFDVVLQEVLFPSRQAFENYVIQWLPYPICLPQELRNVFFSQVIDLYLKIIPVANVGEVMFRFSRIDFIAQKTIP